MQFSPGVPWEATIPEHDHGHDIAGIEFVDDHNFFDYYNDQTETIVLALLTFQAHMAGFLHQLGGSSSGTYRCPWTMYNGSASTFKAFKPKYIISRKS